MKLTDQEIEKQLVMIGRSRNSHIHTLDAMAKQLVHDGRVQQYFMKEATSQ